jgi:hypothetical protein
VAVRLTGGPRAVVAAIVQRAFGSDTALRRARPLSGERMRSEIYRIDLQGSGAPPTAIVKRLRAVTPAETGGHDSRQLFVSELSSLRFLSTLDTAGIAPQLYGDDPAAHVLVMQDLGDRPSLADLLLGSDRDATVGALATYARGLARLHGMSIGHLADFRRIRAELGARADDELWAADVQWCIDGIEEPLAAQEILLDTAARAELAGLRDRLTAATSWSALTHGDPCPDNNSITPEGDLVHFDFEFTRVRPAMIDAAYLTVPFPTCWCVNASPPEVRAQALAVYRSELSAWLPAADDDAVFATAMVDAAAYWLLRDLAGMLASATAADSEWGISTTRQRLVYRLPVFIDLARRSDVLPRLADVAESLHRRLTGRWAELRAMPTYPSLR